MNILVINAGSSSMKYQLMDMSNETVLAKGICERIGIDGSITHKTHDGKKISKNADFASHADAFVELTKTLTSGEGAVISSLGEVTAIGHRVTHGGEKFKASAVIDGSIMKGIKDCCELAPLHNPPQAAAIEACQKVFGPKIPNIAVFDTAFHQTIPQRAYIFGIPYEYYEKYRIRRYGFHGTSHRYVSERYGQLSGGLADKKIVTCHLGNGSSITAVDRGNSVDTSMGFTPLDGIIMGTRAGGIDPSIVTYIGEKESLSPKQLDDLLNKRSGFLGLSGFTSDMREIEAAIAEGDTRAQLTTDVVVYQIKKFIGAYAAAMNGLDAVIFTGGIGENGAMARADICKDMDYLGIKIDNDKNAKLNGTECDLSAADARTRTWIIPTNEELLIARDTMKLI